MSASTATLIMIVFAALAILGPPRAQAGLLRNAVSKRNLEKASP